MTAFFILTCARSGSTSLARILDTATNGTCAVEPMPNLNFETRLAMEGRLENPQKVVEEIVVPRVREGLSRKEVYGEKNVTYGPFIQHLYELTDCKFVFLKRDGRDVVRSLLDWHDQMFGNIYRECVDPGDLSQQAVNAVVALPIHKDTSDFARPRPQIGSKWYERWETMSRFEMCSYYWSTINDLYRNALEVLPSDAWIELDYTTPQGEDILRVAEFCGLKDLGYDQVQEMLDAGINSLKDRGAGEKIHEKWMNWDGGKRRSFDAIAGNTMRRLGYYDDDIARWCPPDYGRCWEDHGADEEWYKWMYDTRLVMHEEAIKWIRSHDATEQPVTSIADFGCGLGVGYHEALADRKYVGIDLISSTIDWCKRNRTNPQHEYHQIDFIKEATPEKYDLVMSSGTIDNAYDVEAYLDAMLRASRRFIYLTCYRGWFPDLAEHNYHWVDKDKCFYTDISARRVREYLESLGCRDIQIEPRSTGRSDIPYETRIMASIPNPEAGHIL